MEITTHSRKQVASPIRKFAGFSPDAFKFFKAIKRNNKREWFLKNKNRYELVCKTPMQALVAELSKLCRDTLPEIQFDPKKSIYRIYRDVRFSKDKMPYKTHIAAAFPFRNATRGVESSGLYLHIEPDSVLVAGGIYMPSGHQLRRIRAAIDRSPQDFLNMIEEKSFVRSFKEIWGDRLKIAPQGYLPDDPMIHYLRLKQFLAVHGYDDAEALRPDFARRVAKHFAEMAPFVRWLKTAIDG